MQKFIRVSLACLGLIGGLSILSTTLLMVMMPEAHWHGHMEMVAFISR
jgi:hypothetical protein